MKTWVRAEWSPVFTRSWKGELAESASSSGRKAAQAVDDADRAVGSADPDVDVEPEAVVAPDDVAEDLVVPPVVRRVDDPLLLPRRPGVRAGRAERQLQRLDERLELGAPLHERGRDLGEGLAAPGLHLDLGGDQLADEVRLERRPLGRRLDLLEAVDEVEARRVEERELLLDRDGEVGALVECLAGVAEELVG